MNLGNIFGGLEKGIKAGIQYDVDWVKYEIKALTTNNTALQADLMAVKSATGELFRYPGRGTSFGPPLRIGSGWAGFQPLL